MALPEQFYINNTKYVKYRTDVNFGFRIEISHRQIESLKVNSDRTNGILKTIKGTAEIGNLVAKTLGGESISVPIKAIVKILVGGIQLYLNKIKTADTGQGVIFTFFVGSVIGVPLQIPQVETIYGTKYSSYSKEQLLEMKDRLKKEQKSYHKESDSSIIPIFGLYNSIKAMDLGDEIAKISNEIRKREGSSERESEMNPLKAMFFAFKSFVD